LCLTSDQKFHNNTALEHLFRLITIEATVGNKQIHNLNIEGVNTNQGPFHVIIPPLFNIPPMPLYVKSFKVFVTFPTLRYSVQRQLQISQQSFEC